MIYEINPHQELNGYAQPWAPGAGKNLLDSSETQIGTISFNTGSTSTSNFRRRTDYLPITGKFVCSGTVARRSDGLIRNVWTCIRVYDLDKQYIKDESTDDFQASGYVYNIAANRLVRVVYMIVGGSYTFTGFDMINWQIELGETVTAYEPYSNICPITPYDLPGIDDPVYGGVLDSNSGVLVSGFAAVDLGSLSWTLDDGVFISDAAPDGIAAPASASEALAGVISTMYPNTDATSAATTPYTLAIDTSKSVIVNDPSYATADAFKAAMDGVIMVYPLAEPVELTLTQEQINVLLAQCGLARNFGNRSTMLNTWMKLAQGYTVPEEELHMLRPTMSLPHDVVLRPTFEDTPLPIVDPPAAEPEENITESEES